MLAVSSSAYWIWKIGSMCNIFWHKQLMMVISLYLELWTTLKGSGQTESHEGVLGLSILKGCHACGPGWVPLNQFLREKSEHRNISEMSTVRDVAVNVAGFTCQEFPWWSCLKWKIFPVGCLFSLHILSSAVQRLCNFMHHVCQCLELFLKQLEYCSEILAYAYVLKMCHLCFLLRISGIQGLFVEETVFFSVYFSPFSEIRGCSCMGYFCICSVSLAICLFLCSPVSLSLWLCSVI